LAAALASVKKNRAARHPAGKSGRGGGASLTARRPKTRYLVGLDAKVGAWLAFWLPDRWRDWLILNLGRRS
jgi:hypothetical protein